MVGFGCDTIPILLYPHNTWIWVGLNWKFMYLSMGSLLDKCHRGYAESCLSHYKLNINWNVTWSWSWFESHLSCGNDTNVPTWVPLGKWSLLLLSVEEIKLALCKSNLELRTLNIVVSAYFSVSCEYFIKYSRLCPWLFKRPDYEEEDQNPENGQQDQDVYDN